MRDWINRHLLYGFTKPGKAGEGTFFGSDFVILWFDAHNGLQMHPLFYTGLNYVSPSGRTVFQEYKMLMEEVSRFSQVVYCYSDCPERFGMDMRLEQEARVLAATARDYGLIANSLASFGDLIKPFCVGMECGGERVNPWHHADFQSQHRLQHFWDRLVKSLTYVAVANSYGEYNGRPSPPDTPTRAPARLRPRSLRRLARRLRLPGCTP